MNTTNSNCLCGQTVVPGVRQTSPWRGMCAVCAAPVKRQHRRSVREYGTPERAAMVKRNVRAMAANAALAGDVDDLQTIADMALAVERATADAVRAYRGMGVSWQAIGDAFGITRQGAQQRWGRHCA